MVEIPLAGGFVTPVVRLEQTVRRAGGSEFAHRLLEHFAAAGWPAAPRYLGTDEAGREILEFLDGFVPWEFPHDPAVRTEAALRKAAVLLRQFHDLTAGTALAGDREVVCHNDLSPKNTVYRDLGGEPVPAAFIDWDAAAPGCRIEDLAHLCWQFIGLGSIVDSQSGRLLRVACDAYGECDRDRLIETVLWWQDRCWRGIESAAALGEPAMIRLAKSGVPEQIRSAYVRVRAHREELERALR